MVYDMCIYHIIYKGGIEMAKPKTPSYIKKANDNYRAKRDVLQLYAIKGEKERFRAVGLDNATILDLVRTECERREKEGGYEIETDD
jgi:hypothetical protein